VPFKHSALVASALGLAACSAPGSQSAILGGSPQAGHVDGARGIARATTPIQHVIFVVQENRSFNDLFLGYPGAMTRSYGYDRQGDKIVLQPEPLAEGWDLGHTSQDFFKACDGRGRLPGTKCRMDGWNNEFASFGAPANAPYSYVVRKDVAVYWKMAQQYVLADRIFASNLDGSFIAHQYIVAAYASHAVDTPDAAWGCEGGKSDTIPTLTRKRTYGRPIVACFQNPTIASEADTAGVSWRFYAGTINGSGGLWSSYQADGQIYNGPDWTADVISPPSQFLTDVASGTLANVTWITPTFSTSDHPGVNPDAGPAWVASIVNAVGESKFWNSSAIFVMWDDWGGWFDPIKPVVEDYDGLGFRVPLIVISPYAKRGYVTHVQYETSSVLRYIEDNFGLPPMAVSDARANDPAADAFDYAQQPRTFSKFRGAESPSHWSARDRAPQRYAPGSGDVGD
jgi:phospholipase C